MRILGRVALNVYVNISNLRFSWAMYNDSSLLAVASSAGTSSVSVFVMVIDVPVSAQVSPGNAPDHTSLPVLSNVASARTNRT